jgi:hypothetical protein
MNMMQGKEAQDWPLSSTDQSTEASRKTRFPSREGHLVIREASNTSKNTRNERGRGVERKKQDEGHTA